MNNGIPGPVFFSSCMVCIVASGVATYLGTTRHYEEQIIERGYAEWVIVDPATGRTEWRWKELNEQ